jgi:hypothetical protein
MKRNRQVMYLRPRHHTNLSTWAALGESIDGFTDEDLWVEERMEDFLYSACICGAADYPPCVAVHEAQALHLRKLWNFWALGSFEAYCDYRQSLAGARGRN